MSQEITPAEKKLRELQQFLPDTLSVSAQAYLRLVADKMKDKNGNFRPAEDLRLFLYQAKRTGLDPMAGQIHAIYRWNGQQQREVMSIQTSIDGLRLIANRTKEYAGQDDIAYTFNADGSLESARACVYRINPTDKQRYPYPATAYWEEYKQVNPKTGEAMGLWGKMPKVMLAKTAEALAMRKAFPQEMSGIYTGDEMAQATPVEVEVVEKDAENVSEAVETPVEREAEESPAAEEKAPKKRTSAASKAPTKTADQYEAEKTEPKVSDDPPREPVAGGMPDFADVSDWEPGQVRDVELYVSSAEAKTAGNGTKYVELWTNYETVKAWKNTAPKFAHGTGHWHKVALEASEFNGKLTFSVVRHYSRISNVDEVDPSAGTEVQGDDGKWDMDEIDKLMNDK